MRTCQTEIIYRRRGFVVKFPTRDRESDNGMGWFGIGLGRMASGLRNAKPGQWMINDQLCAFGSFIRTIGLVVHPIDSCFDGSFSGGGCMVRIRHVHSINSISLGGRCNNEWNARFESTPAASTAKSRRVTYAFTGNGSALQDSCMYSTVAVETPPMIVAATGYGKQTQDEPRTAALTRNAVGSQPPT